MTQPPSFGTPVVREVGAPRLLSGTSGDSKPTNAEIGSIFLETDTGFTYTFTGTVWIRVSMGEVLGAVDGNDRWVIPGYTAANDVNTAINTGTLYFAPIFVVKRTTYDRLGINVTTLSAGDSARLGLYRFADGLPTDLLLDAGTVSVNTTGGKEIVIDQTLDRGYYFTAIVCDGGPAIESIATGSAISYPLDGWGTTVLGEPKEFVMGVTGRSADVAGGLPAVAPVADVFESGFCFVRTRMG